MSFGVLTRGDDGGLARGLDRQLSPDMGDQFRRPDGLCRRPVRGPVGGVGTGFVEGTFLQHQVEATLDPRGKPILRRVDHDRLRTMQRNKSRSGFCLPRSQPASGRGQHLPGALDAHRVLPVDLCRGFRVKLRQKSGGAFGFDPVHGLCANVAWSCGDLGQPFGECREVKPGPADNDRTVLQQRRDFAQPMTDGICVRSGNVTIEVMGQGRLIFLGRAGGKNAPIGEDLKRVRIDDLPTLRTGDFHREGGFAGGRRAGNQNRFFAGERRDVEARCHRPAFPTFSRRMQRGACPMTDASTAYRRVLLKISGEALMGDQGFGLHPPTVERVAQEVKSVHDMGVEICMVIGGGNIFRGLQGSAQGMERTTADYMGMLATVMNALAMQSALESLGVFTRVISAIPMDQVCEPYIRRRAVRHLEKKRVCIFAAGTGNPYFTTDTAATLRASEMSCQAIFKGTKVDGVYDKDPVEHADAVRYDRITYDEVLQKHLKVMDASAIALARDNKLPIIVFSLDEPGGFRGILAGEGTYTIVEE